MPRRPYGITARKSRANELYALRAISPGERMGRGERRRLGSLLSGLTRRYELRAKAHCFMLCWDLWAVNWLRRVKF